MFADVLPKLFGQFGPGEWVFADHCGQCGVGLHGFAKGVFGGDGFFGVGIGQLERAGLGSQAKNQPCFQRFSGTPRRISADRPGTVQLRADLLRQYS